MGSFMKVGKFLKIILATQLAATGSIGFSYIGIEIPILREVFCFIYLTFVPGILILGILKLDRLSTIETVLYSIGLSCSFLIFVGLFMNTIYPAFGITKPLSTTSLLITLIVLISALYLLCFVQNVSYTPFSFAELNSNTLFSPYTLAFLLIPFLAIFGAYLVQFYDSNILLILLFVLISIIPILVAANKIPSKMYPLLVFVIAFSLVYQNVLSSVFIQSSDPHVEYYFAKLVSLNSYWNPSLEYNANSLPANTILPSIFSKILNISLPWTIKIIYPFLMSLVPVGLYQVYKEQTNDKIAFLGSFFFMSFFGFTHLATTMKHPAVEFFLVLLLLLLVSKEIDNTNRVILSIIFSVSMIWSHYGTTYIFLLLLAFSWTLLLLNMKFQMFSGGKINIIRSNFILFFVTLAFSWYIYVAGSKSFESIIGIGNHVVSSIGKVFFNPIEGGGVYWIKRELPLSWTLARYLNYISQFFILIGILCSIKSKSKFKDFNLKNEYLFLSIGCLTLLAASIILPYAVGRGSMDLVRVYHLTLIFLAVFGVIGGLKVLSIFGLINKNFERMKASFVCIFFILLFLFNSGFISEIIQETRGGDYNPSPSIGQPRIVKSGTISEKIPYYGHNYPAFDVYGASWLGRYNNGNKKIFTDGYNTDHILYSYGGMLSEALRIQHIPPIKFDALISVKGYFFLRKINYVDGIMQADYWMQKATGYDKNWWNTAKILPVLENKKNKIYCNGGSIIYE